MELPVYAAALLKRAAMETPPVQSSLANQRPWGRKSLAQLFADSDLGRGLAM
jgi:hypothetical protein